MRDAAPFLMALLAGVAIGTVFFGGLYWTVRHGMASRRPAFLFFVSLTLRMIVTVGALYFVAQEDWRQVPVCLMGFLLARVAMIRMTRRPSGPPMRAIQRSEP